MIKPGENWKYKGVIYNTGMLVRMKNPTTKEWQDAVLYTILDQVDVIHSDEWETANLYVRELQDFLAKFVKVKEDEQH